jgi:hypothetical protein
MSGQLNQGGSTSNAQRTRSATLTFSAVIITFLFTFANVSCQGQHVASLSGFQLAFGTEVVKNDLWGNAKREKVHAEPLALLALLAAAAGAALSLIGPATRRLTTLAAGGGAVLLLLLNSKLERDATIQSSGMLDVSPGAGLILAVILFIVSAGLAWFSGRKPHTIAVPSRAPDKLPEPT